MGTEGTLEKKKERGSSGGTTYFLEKGTKAALFVTGRKKKCQKGGLLSFKGQGGAIEKGPMLLSVKGGTSIEKKKRLGYITKSPRCQSGVKRPLLACQRKNSTRERYKKGGKKNPVDRGEEGKVATAHKTENETLWIKRKRSISKREEKIA